MLRRHLLLAATCLVTVPSARAQQTPAPPVAAHSRQPFVIERFHQLVRLEDDGTGRVELRVRVRVQTEAALQAFGQLTFQYSAANQRLDVDSVRVHKAGGGSLVAPRSAVQDVTGAFAREAPVFTDLREKLVTVPGLRPGDTLAYHLTWSTHTPVARDHFWYAVNFIRDAIVLDERLTLDVPRGKHVQIKTSGGPDPEVTETSDRRIYRWRHVNLQIDTTPPEVSGWGRTSRQPSYAVKITTFRTWADVGRWYAGLERDREAVTPEIREKAEALVRGRTSRQDSIAALYDYVAKNFRYVSLSFGVGRYQPHAASEVLSNQYGDCKDKHVLLAALLRVVGVISAPVLISAAAEIDPDVPSPAQFDHLITYLPADSVWLDATPAVAPFRFLFFNLRDKLALVVLPDSASRLVRTPAAPPFLTFQRTDVEGEMSELGTLTATVHYALRGDAEVVLREVFRQLPEERLNWFGGQIARQHRLDGTVSAMRAADPGATVEPLEFSFRLDHAAAVTWNERRAGLRAPVPPLDLPPEPDEAGADPDTIMLGLLGEQSVRLKLALPATVDTRLPLPVSVVRDYGTYRSSYQLQGRTLIVERVLRFTRRDLPGDRARDVQAFRRTVRDDEEQRFTFTRSADPPGIPAGASATELHKAGLDALEAGDGRSAVRMFQQVVKLEPRHQWAWNNLGRAHMELNQLDSAVAAFRKQVDSNPYDAYAHNNLGLAHWRSRRYEDAEAAFRRQIEVSPLDRYAHANLGRLHLELHRDSAAVTALERAVAIAPDDASLRVDFGKAYLAIKQPDRAVTEFDRAVEIAPEPPIWNNVAYALAQHGAKLDRAEQYVRAAIDATAAILRNVTLEEAGPREAVAVVSLGAYWDTLGWIYFQRGELVAAERYVRAAWLINYRGEVGDHLAQIYERLGRKREAVQTYALAVNAARALPDTRSRLAALVGGAAQADRLARAARSSLVAMRTVRLGHTLRLDVQSEVQVLLAPGPRVEDVRFVSAPDGVHALRDAIQTASFPVSFPDSLAIKLPRRGALTCSSSSGDCTIVLFEVEPIVLRRQIRH